MKLYADPLVVGAAVLLCLLLIRGGLALWREIKMRRQRRLHKQRDVRILIGDYRSRYGVHQALERLEGDMQTSRSRVERLAARWKACQSRADEAVEVKERHALEQEEREAYRAFLAEARRLRTLRGAREQLRR